MNATSRRRRALTQKDPLIRYRASTTPEEAKTVSSKRGGLPGCGSGLLSMLLSPTSPPTERPHGLEPERTLSSGPNKMYPWLMSARTEPAPLSTPGSRQVNSVEVHTELPARTQPISHADAVVEPRIGGFVQVAYREHHPNPRVEGDGRLGSGSRRQSQKQPDGCKS